MKQIYPKPATPMDAADQAAYTFARLMFSLGKCRNEIPPDTHIVKVWRNPATPVKKNQMELSDGTVTDLRLFQLPKEKDV